MTNLSRLVDLPVLVPRDDMRQLVMEVVDEKRKIRRERDAALDALREVQRQAHQAIEAINHGAGVDELRDRFRDIATGARRR